MCSSDLGSTVVLRAHRVDCSVVLEVIDRGPGIPTASRTAAMRPFQRLDDSRHGSGVGLGLAIASGFSSAMHAELCLDDTPGGGLTARIALRTAECANDDLR